MTTIKVGKYPKQKTQGGHMNTEPIQPDSTSLERLRAGDRWREEQESSSAVSNLLAANKRWLAQAAQEYPDFEECECAECGYIK